MPCLERKFGPVRRLLRLLIGAVSLVLLLACGSLMLLLVARAIDRMHDWKLAVPWRRLSGIGFKRHQDSQYRRNPRRTAARAASVRLPTPSFSITAAT